MNLKRIARDVLVLLGFCGAFFALIFCLGMLDSTDADDVVDFSESRIQADRSKRDKDWESAQVHLERLIIKDPFDGRAQFEYATTFYKRRSILVEELQELKDENQDKSPEADQLRTELDKFNRRALEELSKAKEFARYRGRALLFLAVIEAERENWDQTLEYLEEFVEFGSYTFDGLEQALVFGTGGSRMALPGAKLTADTKLHSRGKFWTIVSRETENRSRQ